MRRHALLLVLLTMACAAPQPVPESTEFAEELIARSAPGPAPGSTGHRGRRDLQAPPKKSEAELLRGLLTLSAARVAELRRIAGDDDALDAVLGASPISGELAALACFRSPAVAAARSRYDAARTGFRQSAELRELVSLYRSFTGMETGPEPYLLVSSLSGEVVERTTEMAFEDLRATVRDVVASAHELHADAARLSAARRILSAELDLDRDLLEVLEARLESGRGSQAGLLAFQARVETVHTELSILGEEGAVILARLNRLLSRPPAAGADLAFVTGEAPGTLSTDRIPSTALEERQEYRRSIQAVARARSALRLAETAALPHATFPATHGKPGARPDFGVRAGQVAEMRARLGALEAASRTMRDRVSAEVKEALFALSAAGRRLRLTEQEVLPRAEQAVAAAKGAYEGNRAGYLDLLDASQRLLDARLGQADARRSLARARAGLLRAVGIWMK